MSQAFGLGRVVIPASDGLLAELGHDVRALGERAFGVVVESRGKKSLVDFPALRLRLWLEHGELADIDTEASEQRAEYAKLLPNFSQPRDRPMPAVWIVRHLCQTLPVTHLLGLESGLLSDLWDPSTGALEDHYAGDPSTSAVYVGVGVSELVLSQWEAVRAAIGADLLFVRFLPAGLHKIEVALYLKSGFESGK